MEHGVLRTRALLAWAAGPVGADLRYHHVTLDKVSLRPCRCLPSSSVLPTDTVNGETQIEARHGGRGSGGPAARYVFTLTLSMLCLGGVF